MNTVPLYRSDVPLGSSDLATCQKVLDTLCREAKIHRDSEEWRRISIITIQLVQQGVQEHGDLLAMVRTARGILHPDGDNKIAPYEMGSEAFIKCLDGSANPYAPDSVEAKEWSTDSLTRSGFLACRKPKRVPTTTPRPHSVNDFRFAPPLPTFAI